MLTRGITSTTTTPSSIIILTIILVIYLFTDHDVIITEEVYEAPRFNVEHTNNIGNINRAHHDGKPTTEIHRLIFIGAIEEDSSRKQPTNSLSLLITGNQTRTTCP